VIQRLMTDSSLQPLWLYTASVIVLIMTASLLSSQLLTAAITCHYMYFRQTPDCNWSWMQVLQ